MNLKSVPRSIIFMRAARQEGKLSQFIAARHDVDNGFKPSNASVRQVLNSMNKAVNGENAPNLDEATYNHFAQGLS